jgi:hypothetical protein
MDNQSGNIIVWDFFNKKEKVYISSPEEDFAINFGYLMTLKDIGTQMLKFMLIQIITWR